MLIGIIIGSGQGYREQLEAVEEKYKFHTVHRIGVNKACRSLKVHHLVTLHPDQFRGVDDAVTHSCYQDAGKVDAVWRYNNLGGTSALLALDVARKLHYNKVILCGVPLTGRYGGNNVIKLWERYKSDYSDFCSRVTSTDGKTIEIFGEEEWQV